MKLDPRTRQSDRLRIPHDDPERLAAARQRTARRELIDVYHRAQRPPRRLACCGHFWGSHHPTSGCFVPGCGCGHA